MTTRRSTSEWVEAWRTNHLATAFLVEHLPAALWSTRVPGVARLTVGMIAAHIHNARCRWVKSLGASHGVRAPRLVDPRRVRPRELGTALSRSSDAMVELIELGVASGGRVPPAAWQNFPTDMPHFLSYFAAHEGHHRGQICMAARQLGHRLPTSVTTGIWQWKRLSHSGRRNNVMNLAKSARPGGFMRGRAGTGQALRPRKKGRGLAVDTGRVVVENVNVPGQRIRLDAAMYEAMRKAMLEVLPRREPGLTQAQIRSAVLAHLPSSLYPGGAKAAWWAKTVQLDLEAKRVVAREAGRPLRWHRS